MIIILVSILLSLTGLCVWQRGRESSTHWSVHTGLSTLLALVAGILLSWEYGPTRAIFILVALWTLGGLALVFTQGLRKG